MKKLIIILSISLVILIGIMTFIGFLYVQDIIHQPLQSVETTTDPLTKIKIKIARGATPREVFQLLYQQKLIKNPQYAYYTWRYQLKKEIKAGEYSLSPFMSLKKIVDILSSGKVVSYQFTIPEGYNLFEIADVISGLPINDRDKFLSLARNKELLADFKIPAESLEGYCFPDTYTYVRGQNLLSLVEKMVNRFWQVFNNHLLKRAKKQNFSVHQTVTLASLIEKETGQAQERKTISGVFHNRMNRNMKLQTDPSVIYSILLTRGSFNGNLRRRDLKKDHPYNTYTRKGLPPGPIGNPGKAALEAALWPEKTKNLFFVSKNDGSHIFCPTLKCHNQAVYKWQIKYFRQKRRQKRKSK